MALLQQAGEASVPVEMLHTSGAKAACTKMITLHTTVSQLTFKGSNLQQHQLVHRHVTRVTVTVALLQITHVPCLIWQELLKAHVVCRTILRRILPTTSSR